MNFPAYPEYKDSRVEWVREIPFDWDARPLFSVADQVEQKNIGLAEDNLLSLSYGNIVRKDIEGADGLLPASFETYQILEKYDVVWRLTDLQNDKRSLRTGLVSERGIITSAYLGTRPRSIDPVFFAYLLRAYDLTKVFYSMGGGLRQSMNFSDVKWLPILVPPQADQFAITRFLDYETSKIDGAVAAQERLIALLTEKRGATISHAVTKGLDPDAPMKDSGIEWLSQIPTHWNAKRLRYLCRIETGDGDTQDSLEEGEYPFFVRSPKIERINRYIFDCEAVMTSGDGAGVGKIYHHYDGKFTAHQRVYVFHGFTEILPRLIYYYFQAFFARVTLQGTAKSTVESLRRPMLADFWIVVPDQEEQQTVLDYCEDVDRRFAEAIKRCKESIRLLKERRAALISAAVTGKIDVRGEIGSQEQEAA